MATSIGDIMNQPTHGDKLYRCFNGNLEVVTFLEQNVSGLGATNPTNLCVDATGREFRCSMDMYFTTAKAAYEHYLEDLLDEEGSVRNRIFEAEQDLEHCIEKRNRIDELLKEMT